MGDLADLFPGSSEMARRMRDFAWAAHELGTPATWPRTLQTSVRILLTSRHPMCVWWGGRLFTLYNDGYATFLHARHPAALGQPAASVWPEIWDQLGSRVESARQRTEGTYDEALPLILLRKGVPEETYVTFSYNPIPDDEGGFGGILCPVTEDTDRVVAERQLGVLRELAARSTEARTAREACDVSACALATNPHDLPFALVYLMEPAAPHATRCGHTGLPDDHPLAPGTLTGSVSDPWPIGEAWSRQAVLACPIHPGTPGLPQARGYPVQRAAIVPFVIPGETAGGGVLVAGLNPLRAFDGGYQQFLELIARGIASAVANGSTYDTKHRSAADLERRVHARTRELADTVEALRHEITARQRVEQQASTSQDKYSALVNSIDQGFCLIEALFDAAGTPVDYRFLEVSRSFEKQTGIADPIGRTMREIAPLHEEHWYRAYGRVALTGESVRFEAPAAQLGRWYEVYAFRMGDPSLRRVAILFNDITGRKQTEEALLRSEARHAFLVRLSDEVRRMIDPRAIMAAAAGMLGRQLGVSLAGYVEVAEDEDTIFTVGEFADGRMPAVPARQRVTDYGSAFRDLLRAGQDVFVDDHEADPRSIRSGPAAALHLRASAGIPLVKHGRFVAFLYVADPEPRRWPAHERALLREVAERTWSAVERARAEDSLRRAHDELERRVQERTSELARANASLEAEVRERRAAEAHIKDLLKRLITVQEEERRRIARNIHDRLGQQVTALRMSLDALQPDGDAASLLAQTERAQRLAEELDQSIDVLTWELRPAALDHLGLPTALRNLVTGWSERAGIAAEFDASGAAGLRLEPDVEASLYMVTQEALHNVLKHARATRVSVVLGRRNGQAVLVIEDNGRGFDPSDLRPDPGGGLGVVGMRERATLAGGELEIESAAGEGTTIFVRVPAGD